MIYADEGHAQYYVEKTTGMVKALVSIFEDLCFEKNMIVHLLDVIHPHTVSVYVTPVHVGTFMKLEETMNERYQRKDKMWTCQIIDEEAGSFILFGTDDRKLKYLN